MDAVEEAYRDAVSRWHQKHITNREQLADALSDYRIRFAYNSGNIENPEFTYHDDQSAIPTRLT